MKMMKKALVLAMAAVMVLSMASCSQKKAPSGSNEPSQSGQKNEEFVYDPNNQYPGMTVYHDGDPEANVDAEITSTDKVTWTVATTLSESNPQSRAITRLGEELSERTNGNVTLDTLYENNHTYLVSGYYTNPEAWNALPDDCKALFEGLMEKYLGNYYHEEIGKSTEEAKQIMKDKNVTFVGQDQLDMDAFCSIPLCDFLYIL